MIYEVEIAGNVLEFENLLLEKAAQEIRVGHESSWTKLADLYTTQLEIIRRLPFADPDLSTYEDDLPPAFRQVRDVLDIKIIDKGTIYPEHFYRWGLKIKATGNYRIFYCVHNYYKVVLLHFFEKKYNGGIRREDLLPAELAYEQLCFREPNY